MKVNKDITVRFYDKDFSAKTRCVIPVTQDAVVHNELMQSHYVKLSFKAVQAIPFEIGDFIDTEFGRFELTDVTSPSNDDMGFSYSVQFDACYRKFKNKMLRYRPMYGSMEANFTLTNNISVHTNIIKENLDALAGESEVFLYDPRYKGNGTDYVISIDGSVNKDVSKVITYSSVNILAAIDNIAQAFDCEWWFEGNILHFGTCENTHEVVDFAMDENVVSISSSQSQATYANRVYAFGAARNLPTTYKDNSSADITKYGVIERRLMLPLESECSEENKKLLKENGFGLGNGYIYVLGLNPDQYVDGVTTNDDIYPRNLIKMGNVSSYEKDVEDDSTEDKEYVKRTFYRVGDLTIIGNDGEKTGDMAFRSSYKLSGKKLHVIFKSGALSGMDFECEFNPDGKPEILRDKDGNPILSDGKEQVNTESQVFEIVANEDYGRFLPDGNLRPKAGDTFVLYNWDSSKLGYTLITSASNELLETSIGNLKKSMIDPTTYTCTMSSDYTFNKGKGKYHGLGDRVSLYDKGRKFVSRKSRIIGFEAKLDIPYEDIKYIVGEKPSYSNLKALESKIDEIVLNGQSYIGGNSGNGGGGSSTYIIKSYDKTLPTDYNVYSAKAVSDRFLSSLNDDVAEGIITFMKRQRFREGIRVGDKYTIDKEGNAVLGDVVVDRIHDAASTPSERVIIGAKGFDLYMGEDGKSHAYIDDLVVRQKFFASSAEIRKISYSGGTTVFSNAGSTLAKVSAVFDSNGECVAYKCYACADDGTTKTMNWWHVGMMALCQTFNVKAGKTENLQNRYYWRLVVGVGQETLEDGKLYDYVVLSNKKTFLGSDSYVPTYTDKVIADENDNVLIFGDYGVEVTTDGGMGSMAGVFFEQEGKNTDDGGNLIANRVFYGYEDINGFEPDAPSAGDVIVQVGDQICWKSRGNVIKLSTSTEDNATDNAPSIAMYHNVGALYSTGEKDSNGKDIVSPYQWKTCTCVISPEMELHNAKNFKWFTESPDKAFDPVTVVYQIETTGMFRVGSDGKLTGDNVYSNNQDTRYVAATCYQTMGTEKSVVKQCWWEVSYNSLYIANQYEGATSIVMANGDVAKAPAYISLRCYTLAVAEDGTKSRGDVLLASVDVPVMRDGKKGDAGTTIEITGTITTYAKTKDSTMPDKENDSLWSEKAPALAQGEWLWTRTAVYYSDLSVLYSVSVSRVAKDGVNGENGTSVKITSTSVTYATTSTYKQPTSFPYSSMPSAITLGWYLWTKTVVAYSDGQSTTTMSVSRIGDDGKQGNPGPNGKTTHFAYADSVTFKDGKATEVVGFSTTLRSTSEYIGTYDDENVNDSEDWADYSWTKLKGEQGEQGIPGTDGVGVKSADVMYCIGDSDSTVPADNADWKTLFTELTLAKGKYVWTCTKVIYTKGNPTYSGKQCLGECEDFATVTEQYALSTSSTDAPTSGWGTTYSPAMGKWLWTRSEIVWTDGSKTYTDAVCVSYFGKDGDYTEYHFAISAYKSTLSPLVYPVDINSWSATAIAPTTAKPYVWMRIAKFSGGSRVSTSYVRVSGEDGNDGKPGAYTVYDYKISVLNESDSPTIEPEPAACYPEEWQDEPMAVTKEYPYLWMRMTRKNDPNDDSVTYVCLTGEKGEQGIPGEPGSDGEEGQSALDIVIAPSTLVFDTDEDGLVPSSTSKSATISCYRQGILVKDAIFTQYSTLGCSASVSKNASGTCTITISKIGSQTIDATTTVSVTSGYARVKILDELGVVSYAQVNFAVNVAKFTGQMVMNNKTFKTNFEEITNKFEDTDSAIGDISGKYYNLPDDVKTNEAFMKYTSSIEQTARKISLSVSEKVVGLRNLLVGSDFKRLDDVNVIANGSNGIDNCRLRTGDQLDGYNSCRIIDTTSTSTAYHGVRFSIVPVKGNTKYTLSTMAKRMSSSLGNGCLALIHELANPNASDTVLSGSPSWYLLTTSDAINTWVEKSFTFTTNSATRYLEVYFVVRTTGTFAICKPILEEGDTYNGYSKSENDYNYIGGNLIDNSRLLTAGGSLYSVGGTVMKTLNDEYAYTMASASGGTASVFLVRKALGAYKDYVLSWYVQRTDGSTSGQVTVNFLKNVQYAELYTGLQSQYTQEGGYTDGSGNHSGYFCISNVPTGKMVRMWIHFRLYSALTSSDTIYLQLYGNITAYISRPKLEEGAYPTEWTDNPKTFVEEGSLSNKLYATGIDIESKVVRVTADNFKVRNNEGEDTLLLDKSGKLNANLVEAKVVKTYNENGAHVEIENGLMQVFGTNGIANIRFGVNSDGMAVLSYYDNTGKWLYDLGPDKFDAKYTTGASISSSLYMLASDSDVLGTSNFYASKTFSLGGSRSDTLNVVLSSYSIKLFGSRIYVDDETEISNNPHAGYQPFASKKTGFVSLYKYTAAKEGSVYKPDSERGLTQALAEQADGKYFTSSSSLGSNGVLKNLATGTFFAKSVQVNNAPLPMVTSEGSYEYPAYVINCYKFQNGVMQSFRVYSTINAKVGVSDTTIMTLDV